MKIFSSLVCLVVFSLGFISCQKKSDPVIPSNTDRLTSSPWKLESAGVDQDRNGTIDISLMTMIPDCTTNNSLTFNRDNTGMTDEGATKCNAPDPQTTPFNWSFADAETHINISNSVLGQINGKTKILELTASALSLTKDTILGGNSTALVVRMKH